MSASWKSPLPIPTYSLAQCNQHGHEQFYIVPAGAAEPVSKAEFLAPHRKNFYFLVLMRPGSGRHWVDTQLYISRRTRSISRPRTRCGCWRRRLPLRGPR